MRKLLIVMSVAAAVAFASCQKEESTPATDPNVQAAVDGDMVSNMYANVDNEVDQAISLFKAAGQDSIGKRTVVTVQNPNGTITKTITFTNWAVGKNKKWVKNGQIIVVISADKLSRVIEFNNFTINGKKIEGRKQIVYDAKMLTKTVTLTNGVVTFPDGKTYKYSYTRTWTWVKGADTPLNLMDDEFDLTIKNASGTNRNGVAFTEETITPLHLKVTWPVFVSGQVKRVFDNRTVITDYGNGDEDFIVTITINGVAKTVDLNSEK